MRRIGAGIVAVIGYLLSPLSWWNDAFVNLPLAWVFASLVSLASCRLFAPAMVLGYWLTNVAGILMMARGTAGLVAGKSPRMRKRQLVLSLVAATGYTLVIVLLYALGILKPIDAFLGHRE
jgi:tetrahydromethanopterin S-methyltransferase subunit C